MFETPSEADIKEAEASKVSEESELTGSALERSELERSHLMMYELKHTYTQ